MSKELVIDVSATEINIALLENKRLIELNTDKSSTQFSVGDIYLGKVKKVMAGLNAAFVDVGYEKDAFLHYLDLGPQFQSLNKFIHLNLSGKQKPVMSKFRIEPDIDKNGKISDVLSVGQYIMVQIAKEPISTKGPRLSSEISIPGRNIVLMPFSDKVTVSQKIKSDEEKKRLKKLIESIKPKNFGVIVRTVAESKKVADLDTELRYLVSKWDEAFNKLKDIKPPKLLIGEINRTSAILRDMMNADFNSIFVNHDIIYREIKDYIKTIAPEKEKIVKLYSGKVPIFEQYGIQKQIKQLFGKTVPVKAGAYLIIEHTEALHVVDVNSGNRTKSDKDQEANAIEVNVAAAEEIARQLTLRDMGGIIVVDFIDMVTNENKQLLYEKMKEFMALDRAKHHLLPLSKFGLMQITRQRVRPEMNIKNTEKCPVCMGSGEIIPSVLLVDQIENELGYYLSKNPVKKVVLKVHPYLEAYLNRGFFNSIRKQWQKKHKCKIKIVASSSLAFLQHQIVNVNEEVVTV
ncbi:MAG: ribonuclease G [Bacteroidetes bacterium GWF2_38_335]|nr:MAG: ribonuclease G [Bacteroidetes bacterium GWF2_38_335]OFY78713.1 MAG: ribonuclease G [Bacteroidetes bacterium RIFOXYA12_FULL_38_20]HBS88473.1 ribonuclease E/G [Bacteroidales bacterium]